MTTDIIDDIDALEAEVGEYEIAYLQGDYERCARCGRHWHGLPLTARVAQMYHRGHYDRDYQESEDTSEIVCEGSTFIGPRRPTATERARVDTVTASHTITVPARQTQFMIMITDAAARTDNQWRERRTRWQAALTDWVDAHGESSANLIAMAIGGANPSFGDPRRELCTVRFLNGEMHQLGAIVFDEVAFDVTSWFSAEPSLPPWWLALCGRIEFGPQWWHHEVDAQRRRREYAHTHFPRTPGISNPLERAVRRRWHSFCAPWINAIPTPARTGYDWTSIEAQLQQVSGHGPNHPRRRRGPSDPWRIDRQTPDTPRRQRGRRRA